MKQKMSATELGALWMTFQKKTMILVILDYFIAKSEDKKAQKLMIDLSEKLHVKVKKIKKILEEEGCQLPVGFTKQDVNIHAEKLFDHGFDIMFCRVLKEISMGMYVLHMTISYRADIIALYRKMTDLTQTYYDKFTQYLVENNYLPTPTLISMPESTDFINDKNYMKGSNFLGEKRTLNAIEFGMLYHTIETNITGMQLIKAFAQCTKDKDVQQYLIRGKELSKQIIEGTNKILNEFDLFPPITAGSIITNSEEAPFSEKLMLFCTYLLGSFSIGGQGFSAVFNMRNDIMVKASVFAQDTYKYTRDGAKLLMEKGWLEEPPKMQR